MSGEHCIAAAWWLQNLYLPWGIRHWRIQSALWSVGTRGSARDQWADLARGIVRAAQLAKIFGKMGQRHIRKSEATRTINRDLAAWFGTLLDGADWNAAPPLFDLDLLKTAETEGLHTLKLGDARRLLLGLAAGEAMRICAAAVRSEVGSPKKLRTLAEVENLQAISDEDAGRYRRRLRARAKVVDDFEKRLQALGRRSVPGFVVVR